MSIDRLYGHINLSRSKHHEKGEHHSSQSFDIVQLSPNDNLEGDNSAKVERIT